MLFKHYLTLSSHQPRKFIIDFKVKAVYEPQCTSEETQGSEYIIHDNTGKYWSLALYTWV